MEPELAQRAIESALARNWDEAAEINLQILKVTPDDIDALNRLSRAYQELGLIPKAKGIAQRALKVDPTNTIAQRALEKLKTLKKTKNNSLGTITAESFLEEPGKTKLVGLIHPGDKSVLAALDAGDTVNLLTHPHRVSVVTLDGNYVGRLPDDLAARLRKLIKDGNQYQVLIKSIDGRNVKVFIKGEVASFPREKIEYVSFTPPELVHKETPEIPFPEE